MYVLIKLVGDNGLRYKITARENIIGIDYTLIPIERNLVVGDLYRYKLQLSYDPSKYMTYKIVNNVDRIRCIYQGSYNDC